MSGGAKKVKASPGEKENARLAGENWGDYQKRFVPLENQYMSSVDRLRDDKSMVVGKGNADLAEMFDPTTAGLEQVGFSGGKRAGSSASVMGSAGRGVDHGLAGAKINTDLNAGVEDRYYAGQNQVIAMGRGQASEVGDSTRTLGRLGTEDSRQAARQSIVEDNAKSNMYGTLAGAGSRYVADKFEKLDLPRGNRVLHGRGQG